MDALQRYANGAFDKSTSRDLLQTEVLNAQINTEVPVNGATRARAQTCADMPASAAGLKHGGASPVGGRPGVPQGNEL